MPALSVIQKLCLPERMKNTVWPENLAENFGSNVRMEKWATDFKGLLFSGTNKFLTQNGQWNGMLIFILTFHVFR